MLIMSVIYPILRENVVDNIAWGTNEFLLDNRIKVVYFATSTTNE